MISTDPSGAPSSRALRATFIVAGVVLLALWGASALPIVDNWNNPNEDGFDAIPVFYASLTVLPIGLVVLAGAIQGSASSMRRARGGLIAAAVVLGILVLFLGFMQLATVMNWG